jgi:hypothetical protein
MCAHDPLNKTNKILFYWCVATSRTLAFDVFLVFAIRVADHQVWGSRVTHQMHLWMSLNIPRHNALAQRDLALEAKRGVGRPPLSRPTGKQNCRGTSSQVRIRMTITKVVRDPREGSTKPSEGPWTHQSATTPPDWFAMPTASLFFPFSSFYFYLLFSFLRKNKNKKTCI